MVNAVRNITRMGADVRQIAKLLQAKAPPGHKLAYINEEEAKLLKRKGGSGRITKEGIPSYEDGTEVSPPGEASYTPPAGQTSFAPLPDTSSSSNLISDSNASPSTDYSIAPQTQAAGVPSNAPITSGISPSIDYSLTPTGTTFTPGGTAVGQAPDASAPQLGGAGGQPIEPTTPKAPPPDSPMSDRTKAALGIGGLQAILGAQQIKKAQAGAGAPSAALSALGVPQQQAGAQEMAQAQRGELTAGNQATIQAARAQLGQGIANRGGVGVAQSVNQITTLTNQFLQQQYTQGSQDLAAGNKYAASAIQLGVQQDQYIQSMTANYVANLARTVASLYGATPQTNETKPNVSAQ